MAKPKLASRLTPNTVQAGDAGLVECLGLTFESEDARRAHFLTQLKDRLPALRERHDFPIGEDQDILRLSDPPYYTACPNPFLAEFVAHYGKPYDPDKPYHREPFAVDVSVGKTDPLYKAHGYHTKVPHKAIVPSILHYTEPGDIVLDGFCGSGMTGVAAQWCGTPPTDYRMEIEQQWAKEGRKPPKWGTRRAILADLSPAATFIAANYNTPFDVDAFAEAARQLLHGVEKDLGWMYETTHTDRKTKGRIDYTVWSEVFTCPECDGTIVFLEHALDKQTRRISSSITCPDCGSVATKEHLHLQFLSHFDGVLGRVSQTPRRVPVLIAYTANGRRHVKAPDAVDLDKLADIANMTIPPVLPTSELPDCQMTRVGRMRTTKTKYVHQMFLPRSMQAMSSLWKHALQEGDVRIRSALLFFVDQGISTMSVLNRYRANQGSQSNQVLSGVFYVPSQIAEVSPSYRFSRKRKTLSRAFRDHASVAGNTLVSTADCAASNLDDQTVDYIFTAPPFGENIYYADLNHLVESWHGVMTNNATESIVDRVRGKGIAEYQSLMQSCFDEYYRVLKPGRWLTMVFHNSRSAVWNAIQEALLRAGFVVADVRVLDKIQSSFKQITSNAVKRDLVVSAYKPNGGLEERFAAMAGEEAALWDFVTTHLGKLPVAVTKNDAIEAVAERQDHLLFDRMVAFHVLRGVTVPLSATEFYQGLRDRFPSRDRMYFLAEQVVEYDRQRASVSGVNQLELFVKDEETAIQWLRQQLDARPQTYQNIHPSYIKELAGWAKHETQLDLLGLLRENFLHYDGQGEVPLQIYVCLLSDDDGLRTLSRDALTLRNLAKGRWYVPDPNRAGDLERLRHRRLLDEFEEYRASPHRLRLFRLEAIRAGFRRAWQAQDYATIVSVAAKVPEIVLQEDPKLLMWYDQAAIREASQKAADARSEGAR